MTQELQVLKCFSCETFQSHIVKKTNKWECKICGTKQSIKKVYGRGSGKDCRLHTQKLNALRGEKVESKTDINDEEENKNAHYNLQLDQNALLYKTDSELSKKHQFSKWSAYLDEDNNKTITVDSGSSLEEKNSREFTAKKRKRQPETVGIGLSKAPGSCNNLFYDQQGNNCFTSYSYDAIKIKKGEYFDDIQSLLQDDKNVEFLNNRSINKSTVKKDQIKICNFNSSLNLKWSKYLDPRHNSEDESSTNLLISKSTVDSQCKLGDLSDNSSPCICIAGEPYDTKMKNMPNSSCNSYFVISKSHHHSPNSLSEAKVEQLTVSLALSSDKNPDKADGSRKAEESEPSKMLSLPAFEQACEFNDSDFVLDF